MKDITFYKDDTWHVDVAKLSILIDSIMKKAENDTSEAAVVLATLFQGYTNQWGTVL